MLTALHIENIAIIDRLDVEFDRGFSVLTGETGAGKSIIIDSILLLLGNKASKELICSGKEAGIVSACFSALCPEALALLAESGLQPDEDSNITVYRKIGSDGRNSARINGISVTVSFLKELGQLLINIHGQHDGVLLLDSKRHLSFLDEFGGSLQEKANYFARYSRVKELRDQLSSLKKAEAEKEVRKAALSENLKRINECGLRLGEHEDLLAKRNNLLNNEKITEALNTAVMAVYDGETPAARLVREALNGLTSIEKSLPQGSEMVRRLTQISAELDDLGAELGKLFDEYAAERMDPDEIEKRLDQLEQIKKEFGPTDQDVLHNQESFQEELQLLDHTGAALEKLEQSFLKARSELDQCATKLTEQRKNAAHRMEKRLEEELAYLDMPKVHFQVLIQDRVNDRGGIRYRSDGKDDVEFYLSSNVGQEMRPLAKVASGGELSRIMLSIKSVLNQGFDTVIYDEIDTGVSGATAEKIGKKLKSSAGGKQVFCITHLAQIAAQADHHYKVIKTDDQNKVYSEIHELNEQERTAEIARIMGGEELTETLLQSAKEILDKGRNKD